MLASGAALIVRGPNGAGKTSLLRIIAGLLTPSAGSVAVNGRLALSDGRLALDPEVDVRTGLEFWWRLDGLNPDSGTLDKMGIAHLADTPIRMLSSGQRQRVDLARLIGSDADIWLLDEPSNALDQAAVRLLESAIAAHRAKGSIVIVATHLPLHVPDAENLVLGA